MSKTYKTQVNKLNREIKAMILLFEESDNDDRKILSERFNKKLEKDLSKHLNEKDLCNLKFRRDTNRGYFSFFWNVYQKTREESKVTRLWANDIKKRGHKVSYRSHGVDNKGYPVLISEKKLGKADYKVTIDGEEYFIDVKTSPTLKCFTFKANTIKRYIKNNIKILLIMKDGPNLKYWQILGKDFMTRMYEGDIGVRGCHFGGGKTTMRIWQNTYEKMIDNGEFAFFEFGSYEGKFDKTL